MVKKNILFNQKLVLNQWMLGLFGVESFDELAIHLKDDELEGLDDTNIHNFHKAICLHISNKKRPELTNDILLEYDNEIVTTLGEINQQRHLRGEPAIVWKYFQYLALLFTEIYLDRYFTNPLELLKSLNRQIVYWNQDKSKIDELTLLDERSEPKAQINKIAYWMATGSGKTLLMHANIIQYQRHLKKHGLENTVNKTILLTPNEGLSKQHLKSFISSGIQAEIFDKNRVRLSSGQIVDVLEVTKLDEEMGDKKVAVSAFEGNNLVLVDEGHRGASTGKDGVWIKHREKICENGFSFEYSATFGHVLKKDKNLINTYSRGILFDYSYKWFYGDGFGKDYSILNLKEDKNEQWMNRYLTACLLTFFQQQRVYQTNQTEFAPFNLAQPLWVFVGSSVTGNAVRTIKGEKVSDVITILEFLKYYVENEKESIQAIQMVLNGELTTDGEKLFAGRFSYLETCGLNAKEIFKETLITLFNAQTLGGVNIDNLKGAKGELVIRIGDNTPFGLINIGDDTKLMNLCEERGFNVHERQFSGSMFQDLSSNDSQINLLIGSKKFTEGWNSWRVSTMGLMNVGRSEGAQIIQLFGRGVRLKGFQTSLKRSSSCTNLIKTKGLTRPKHINILETLSVFGVRADYMTQFRDFLEEEGLSTEDQTELIMPINTLDLNSLSLKMIRVKTEINGVGFESGDPFQRTGPTPILSPPNPAVDESTGYLQKNKVVLDWYPKLTSVKSKDISGEENEIENNEDFLSPEHIALLDIDNLFFDLERFKTERGWHNLSLTRSSLQNLLADNTWYQLFIPKEELKFGSYEKVRVWQEIARLLLRKYAKSYYNFRRMNWEGPHLEYIILDETDQNFPRFEIDADSKLGYSILVDSSEGQIINKLQETKKDCEDGKLKSTGKFGNVEWIDFDQHLYSPLLAQFDEKIKVAPVQLNKGELQFVNDLNKYWKSNRCDVDYELYVLRNMSRGKGIGFFEAGNFHPDFILWQVKGDLQRITYVDPKGIYYVKLHDPKIKFFETVKNIEERLGDESVTLDSFIVSVTPSSDVDWGLTKEEMNSRHVVFQKEDKDKYIEAILEWNPINKVEVITE